MIISDNGQVRLHEPGVLIIGSDDTTGVLTGTTGYVGPPERLGACLVQLLQADTVRSRMFPFASLIRQVRSHPDGTWAFDRLDPAKRYDVIAYDPTGEYSPVVKINLIATVPD